FSTLELEIEEPSVDDDAVEVRLTELRERFGTLVGVDRPAEDRDFVSLDLVATIDDEEIESVEGVSYQIGDGNMLEGLDEALTGLSAEETTTFVSKLAGGERAGEEAQIKVPRSPSRSGSCPRPTTSSPRWLPSSTPSTSSRRTCAPRPWPTPRATAWLWPATPCSRSSSTNSISPCPTSWWRTRSSPTWRTRARRPGTRTARRSARTPSRPSAPSSCSTRSTRPARSTSARTI